MLKIGVFWLWRCFFGRVVPDVLQDPSVFLFIVKLKPLGSFLPSGTACLTKERHNKIDFTSQLQPTAITY